MRKSSEFNKLIRVRELKAKYELLSIKRAKLKEKQKEIKLELYQIYTDFKNNKSSLDPK